jgi:hypothetical protein
VVLVDGRCRWRPVGGRRLGWSRAGLGRAVCGAQLRRSGRTARSSAVIAMEDPHAGYAVLMAFAELVPARVEMVQSAAAPQLFL